MIGLLQRVSQARVEVGQQIISRIGTGLLVFVAVEPDDTTAQSRRMLERLLNYRLFSDSDGKMNLSLLDIRGELLLVPQFTLAANTDSGNRPSFSQAASAKLGRQRFTELVNLAQETNQATKITVATGEYGADMQVSLTNNGPVTFYLRV